MAAITREVIGCRLGRLTYDGDTRSFALPANHHWRGGTLNVIGIVRRWYL